MQPFQRFFTPKQLGGKLELFTKIILVYYRTDTIKSLIMILAGGKNTGRIYPGGKNYALKLALINLNNFYFDLFLRFFTTSSNSISCSASITNK